MHTCAMKIQTATFTRTEKPFTKMTDIALENLLLPKACIALHIALHKKKDEASKQKKIQYYFARILLILGKWQWGQAACQHSRKENKRKQTKSESMSNAKRMILRHHRIINNAHNHFSSFTHLTCVYPFAMDNVSHITFT